MKVLTPVDQGWQVIYYEIWITVKIAGIAYCNFYIQQRYDTGHSSTPTATRKLTTEAM